MKNFSLAVLTLLPMLGIGCVYHDEDDAHKREAAKTEYSRTETTTQQKDSMAPLDSTRSESSSTREESTTIKRVD